MSQTDQKKSVADSVVMPLTDLTYGEVAAIFALAAAASNVLESDAAAAAEFLGYEVTSETVDWISEHASSASDKIVEAHDAWLETDDASAIKTALDSGTDVDPIDSGAVQVGGDDGMGIGDLFGPDGIFGDFDEDSDDPFGYYDDPLGDL